jgi:hypothetical protein
MSLFHLRTSNPQFLGQALAYKRVARGIRQLDERAPKDWWLRFFVLYPGGGWRCRVRNSFDNESALAIAFESDSRYANQFGYVTFGSVAHYLNIDPFDSISRPNGFMVSHGFSDDGTLVDMIRAGIGKTALPWHRKLVSDKMLDRAWSDLVHKIHYDRLLSPKHYSIYDRAIDARLAKIMSRPIPWYKPFLDWVGRIQRTYVPLR